MHRFLLLLLSFAAFTVSVGSSAQTGQPTLFTPLHTYYMAASGCSDANAGTSPAAPWCSPNHSVVCGDVIVSAAGNYSGVNMGNWGAVSNCPSTSGGIDGTGGIYFAVLLCGGADLEACTTSGELWNIPKSNWSIQGWKVTFPACTTTRCGSEGRGFNFDGCNGVVHHFAAINNVFYSVASAVHTDDCGSAGSGIGADYVAAVGNIAVKASMNSSFPEAAFDIVGPGKLDTNPGTHHYLNNNYTWNNDCGTACNQFDSESFMFDTWDAHPGNNYQGVVSNNISWNSKRYCLQIVGGSVNTITPTMKVYNNTCFHNNVATAGDSADGELNIALGQPWTINIFNNIAFQTLVTSSGGGDVYALVSGGGLNSSLTIGGTGKQNILKGSDTHCASSLCDSGNNVAIFNGNSLPGPNGIYVNPGFNNTADLLANRSGNTPNCSGFYNATLCMGYNPNTQTLTNPSVIYDLQPNPNCGGVTGQCSGKGFQLPSTVCASSGDVFNDYPVWLKGIVYLRVVNNQVFQYHDLATTSCRVDPAPKAFNTHDFNGDGKSDILWQDTSGSGSVDIFLMNGAQILQNAGVANALSPWSIVGQRDFDGDGKSDILWRDTSAGTVAMWFMNGTQLTQSVGVANVATAWKIVGTGDFNGDGKGDILWQDTSGNVAIWLMNGAQLMQNAGVANVSGWSIAGTGDFNGDGKTDILWSNSSGTVAIWFMNGTQLTQSVGVANAPSGWTIAGVGDFNGDGKSDILWQDGSGNVAIWLMNGAQLIQSVGVGNASGWSIIGTGDFNGDGTSDILWRNSSGIVAIWLMNNAQITQSVGVANVATNWSVQGANAD
jgi:FG-GAP-like repeat